MSNVSTYKRTGTYTLRDGTVKNSSYEIHYIKKLPKFTTHKKLILRQTIRKSIQNLESGEMLDKFNHLLEKLQGLDISDALSLLDSVQTVITEEVKKIDDEDLPPPQPLNTSNVAITC